MILGLLGLHERGPKSGEIERLATRDPFSAYLPYLAYDAETGVYLNADETQGFIWECRALTFMSSEQASEIANLFRQAWGDHFVFQFTLLADDDLSSTLEHFEQLKTRNDPVTQEAARRYREHLEQARSGLGQMRGLPVRQFRLLVSIKSDDPLSSDRIIAISEALSQVGLSPRPCSPKRLLGLLRWLLNDQAPVEKYLHDRSRPLRDQIIDASTRIQAHGNGLKIGSRHAACLSPKGNPDTIDTLASNRLIGGYLGREDDARQLTCRFLWTTTVFFHASSANIKRQANFHVGQRAGGTLAKSLGRRVAEADWVLDELEKQPYVNVIQTVWVFDESAEQLERHVSRLRSLWEGQHFIMQRESIIQIPLLLLSLPMGLYLTARNVRTLNRDFPMSCEAAARMLPVQADFDPPMAPVMPLIARKGNLFGLDVFDKRGNNYNFAIMAGSGAGKSFFTNLLLSNYYGTGSFIRAVDIGGSYRKLTAVYGGRYIDIGDRRNRVVLNPFVSRGGDQEDQAGNQQTTANIILMMIFSSSGLGTLQEEHYTLAKDGVAFALERDGGIYGIDHVHEFLQTYPQHYTGSAIPSVVETAHKMAFNLRDYTSSGPYGHFFNGPGGLDMASDDLVVLELETLLTREELFRIVAFQVLNAVTQDLYLSDRSTRRFMLFDEAWKYFADAPMIAKVIEEGYRRARKYGGATGLVTQSPADFKNFGPAGNVINANAAYKFYLQLDDFPKLSREGDLPFQGLDAELCASVKSYPPYYSEALIQTPHGMGVGRLCVDKWTYWLATSAGNEYHAFTQLLETGMSPKDALTQLAGG